MAKVDKNATPAYEIIGDKVKRFSVTEDEFNKKDLEAEKNRLEQRLAEINEMLGA